MDGEEVRGKPQYFAVIDVEADVPEDSFENFQISS
jgi:hypothetical protein